MYAVFGGTVSGIWQYIRQYYIMLIIHVVFGCGCGMVNGILVLTLAIHLQMMTNNDQHLYIGMSMRSKIKFIIFLIFLIF